MSKDKGSKNIKKEPTVGGNKSVSDYQAGKKSVSKDEVSVFKKK